jgi:lysophospholipase L1-like esterase
VRFGPNRMAIPLLETAPGQFVRRSFAAHVDDGSLRLHFTGKAPRVNAVEIERAEQATTVFLAGDSTVTDQEVFPYAGWGQMLPAFFKTDAAVANHAKSGRSSKSFIGEGRLDAIVGKIKPRDFLFVQFGHNDQKSDEERHTDPRTTYKEYLRRYVDAARAREAIPVLITPVERRLFDEAGNLKDSHGEYLTAVRELAAEQGVPLIDLAAKSRKVIEELGDEGSKSLFMWSYPGEFPDFPDGAADNTHFNETGGMRMAGLVAEGIRELNLLPLSLYLR